MTESPEHLKDKYRIYAIWVDGGYSDRPLNEIMMVHVAQPVSFRALCDIIFNNIELTIEKTGQKIQTSKICGIQKIPNANVPNFELIHNGILREIIR